MIWKNLDMEITHIIIRSSLATNKLVDIFEFFDLMEKVKLYKDSTENKNYKTKMLIYFRKIINKFT